MFANDPFASTNVSNSQVNPSESPTPELPPKKSKAPPPRPAPPKHSNKPPPRPAPPQFLESADNLKNSDPWSSTGSSLADPFASTNVPSNQVNSTSNFDAFGSNFADFANFDKVN